LYQESGVKEYWLVYPYEQSVHQFFLNEQTEKYELIAMFSAEDNSSPALFPDLVIDLAGVFAE
jgi:Uma2 family endonuclease